MSGVTESSSIRAALTAAAAQFDFSPTPRLDAELLMAHALGATREALLLKHLGDPAPDSFASLAERRAAHEPVAYITGTRAFWTIQLSVGHGVLIPRADSETLIEAAVGHFGERAPRRILDLGTGPGTLLLAALVQWPEAHGLGVDADERALDYAALNAGDLGLRERARFQLGDWATGIDDAFDLILANPPYVAGDEALPREVRNFEPGAALFAGDEGLDDYRLIAPALPRLLAPGGVACVEIGAAQGESAAALFRAQGLHVTLRQDLGGRDRCLVVTP